MKAIEKEKLWEEYQKNPTPKLREQLIIEYAQLVACGRTPQHVSWA